MNARASGFDVVLVVGGASRGFTVLLLGGAVQPWVGSWIPALGYWWLAIVAMGAFVLAAWPRSLRGVEPAASRRDRALVGAAAALGSYVLVVPLVLAVVSEIPWSQLGFTSLTALVVGSVTGAFGSRP